MDEMQKVEIVKMVSQVDWTNIVIAFMGVIGTFFAAIYGGKKTMEAANTQFDHERQLRENERNEKRIVVNNSIKLLLRNELQYNYEMLLTYKVFESVNENPIRQYSIGETIFKFDEYEKLKFELTKFLGETIVENVLYIYYCLDIIRNKKDLNTISPKNIEEIKACESIYKNLIDELNR